MAVLMAQDGSFPARSISRGVWVGDALLHLRGGLGRRVHLIEARLNLRLHGVEHRHRDEPGCNVRKHVVCPLSRRQLPLKRGPTS